MVLNSPLSYAQANGILVGNSLFYILLYFYLEKVDRGFLGERINLGLGYFYVEILLGNINNI
jgi:hypothetical protein